METRAEVNPPAQRSRKLSTASVITDLAFENPVFGPEEIEQVGNNRYLIRKRNTKIFLE